MRPDYLSWPILEAKKQGLAALAEKACAAPSACCALLNSCVCMTQLLSRASHTPASEAGTDFTLQEVSNPMLQGVDMPTIRMSFIRDNFLVSRLHQSIP